MQYFHFRSAVRHISLASTLRAAEPDGTDCDTDPDEATTSSVKRRMLMETGCNIYTLMILQHHTMVYLYGIYHIISYHKIVVVCEVLVEGFD